MLIKLTKHDTGMTFAVDQGLIIIVDRSPGGLEAIVVTSMMGQSGPMAYHVRETFDEVFSAVNRARRLMHPNASPAVNEGAEGLH
jgi:hypothetical protein